MANVKSGAYREVIIDRCLQSRRGYSTQEIFDKCNAALERRNETPITALNTIRNDILAIENRWHIEVEQIRSGREIRYRYKDPHFSIYNNPLNENEITQLSEAVSLLRRFEGMPGFGWVEEMSAHLQATVSASPEPVIGFDENKELKGTSFFTPLFKSITNKQALSITYKSYKTGKVILEGCRFRDDIRRFIRGDENTATAAATRIAGSSDLIELTNGKLKYDKTLTKYLDKGGELYFQVNTSNVENGDELIPIYFSLTHEVYGDYIYTLNYERTIELEKSEKFILKVYYTESTDAENFVVINVIPENDLDLGYVYVSYHDKPSASINDYFSDKFGENLIVINKNYFLSKFRYISIKFLEETTVKFRMSLVNEIDLENYSHQKIKKKISDELKISFTKKDNFTNNKIIIYSLGENYKYFNMRVEFKKMEWESYIFEVKQIFDNGYGAVIDFTLPEFEGVKNPKINIIINHKDDKYKDRYVEIGSEIIDNSEEIREINILEHIYGYAEKETCYKLKDIKDKAATMIINTFTQGVLFRIKDYTNTVVYSLDIFNNYFIRLPYEFFAPDNYFCFKHLTPKESDEEVYGEISYDFQIYYEDELSQYQ